MGKTWHHTVFVTSKDVHLCHGDELIVFWCYVLLDKRISFIYSFLQELGSFMNKVTILIYLLIYHSSQFFSHYIKVFIARSCSNISGRWKWLMLGCSIRNCWRAVIGYNQIFRCARKSWLFGEFTFVRNFLVEKMSNIRFYISFIMFWHF